MTRMKMIGEITIGEIQRFADAVAPPGRDYPGTNTGKWYDRKRTMEPQSNALWASPHFYGAGICAWAMFEYALSPEGSTAVVA